MNSTIAFSSQHQASQFASAAGITLWAYDYLVTFSEEIDLLWGGSVIWWLKVLFLSNRLIPILETFSVGQIFLPLLIHMDSTKEFVGTFEYCYLATSIITISPLIQSLVLHIIFTTRIWTISYMYPRLRIALLTVLISCEVTSTILTALHITQLASHLTYSGEAHTCLYLKPASNLIPIMLGMSDLVIETFIFGATIFHSFHFRQSLSIIKGARSIGILARLSAQGVQYYLFVFVFRLATILTHYLAPLGIKPIFPIVNFYIMTTFAARFVLSLQQEIVKTQTFPDDDPQTIITSTSIARRRPEASRFSTASLKLNDDSTVGKRPQEKTVADSIAMDRFDPSDRRQSIPSSSRLPGDVT